MFSFHVSINYYSSSPPNQGLLDLPAKWWIEVQRVLFDSGPEDGWNIGLASTLFVSVFMIPVDWNGLDGVTCPR